MEGTKRNAQEKWCIRIPSWQLWVNHFQSNLHPLLWGKPWSKLTIHYRGLSAKKKVPLIIPGKFRGRFSTTPVLKMAPESPWFLGFEDLIPSDIKLRKLTQATRKNSCQPHFQGHIVIVSSSPLVKCCFQTITKLKLLGDSPPPALHEKHSPKQILDVPIKA